MRSSTTTKRSRPATDSLARDFKVSFAIIYNELAEQLDEEGIPVPETRGSPWFDDHEPSPFTLSAEPVHRADPKVGRNAPCPCGSGKKYKKCCLRKR